MYLEKTITHKDACSRAHRGKTITHKDACSRAHRGTVYSSQDRAATRTPIDR